MSRLPASTTCLIVSVLLKIRSSIVLWLVSSTVNEITGFMAPIFGPTATTSGEFGVVLFGVCNNHPSGTLNPISCSVLSYFWLPVDGVMVDSVRSGSCNSRIFETSERLTIVTLVILTCSGSCGLSWEVVSTDAILSNVSKLSSVTILPNTVYCSSRKFESACTIKNCEPPLFGSADLAIETIPRLCFIVLNSASTLVFGPPVPQVLGSPSIVFGSPPWIINPGIILWKRVPS